MMCLHVDLFEFFLFGVYWASWMCRLIFFIKWGKFSCHYFFKYSPCLFLSFFSLWDSHMLVCLNVPELSESLLFFLNSFIEVWLKHKTCTHLIYIIWLIWTYVYAHETITTIKVIVIAITDKFPCSFLVVGCCVVLCLEYLLWYLLP